MAQKTTQWLQKFPILQNQIQLEKTCTGNYCESTGRKAAIFGTDRGSFEIWVYPFKIVSDLEFSVYIPAYGKHVHCSAIASRMIVRPELTTIIYSHELFSIKQHLLTPLDEPGCVILLDVTSRTALEIWVSFVPNLIPMWPAGLGGQYTFWLEDEKVYFIGESRKKYAGIIGSPLAQRFSESPGHQLPDQPMKFVMNITPEQAEQIFVPIIITGSINGPDEAVQNYQGLKNSAQQFYLQNYEHYQQARNNFLSIHSDEPDFDLAVEWAKISLEKGLVSNPQLGTGLVAGYGVSGQTHRPGFGWFFGGDTFINSLAINRIGDFDTVKTALKFFRKYQREDGKIPHEITQSAALIPWFEEYPYCFYHSDTTAYYIIAMYDYFVHAGDEDFIRESLESIKKAYEFCVGSDEDGDGLMENSVAGLAAMEVGKLLSETQIDIYLASLWIKAIQCMAEISEYFNLQNLKGECELQLKRALKSFEKIFINDEQQRLNFSKLTNGEIVSEATVWQAIPLFFKLIDYQRVRRTIEEYCSSSMSTDWGIRSLHRESKFYDPLNYNNGTVWPFTTGFVAGALYQCHRSLSGWQNLLSNVRMTYLDSPGWQPELLSGEFYCPLETSVPHQLFSASSIITPLVAGLLGLEGNVIQKKIDFAPHLPYHWSKIEVKNFHLGSDRFHFKVEKSWGRLTINIQKESTEMYQLFFSPAFAPGSKIYSVTVNGEKIDCEIELNRYDVHCPMMIDFVDPSIRIEIEFFPGIELLISNHPPVKGDFTTGLKLIDYHLDQGIFNLQVEGMSGNSYSIPFRSGYLIKKVKGGKIQNTANNEYHLFVKFRSKKNRRYETKNISIHLSSKKK